MLVTRTRAIVVAALAVAACDDPPSSNTTPSATVASTAAPKPKRAAAPTPLPTSSGPAPEPPSVPKLDEVKGDAAVTFAFSPPLEAPFTVDTVRIKQRSRGGSVGGREVLRTVEKVTVTKASEGYRWRSAPVSFSVHGERTSRVDELVAGFEVTYLLDAGGAVTAVEGYGGLDDRAKKMLAPDTLAKMGPMLTADALKRTRASEWRGRMGDLVGRTVALDEPLVTVSEVPLPKGSATVYGVFRFGPWLDCPAFGRCLRIEGYQHTSPEALAALAKVPVETIHDATPTHDAHDEAGPHGHGEAPASSSPTPHDHGHDHARGGKAPPGPAIAMGIHSLRIVDPSTSMPIWELMERELDLGLAQLSDATTSSYAYPEK